MSVGESIMSAEQCSLATDYDQLDVPEKGSLIRTQRTVVTDSVLSTAQNVSNESRVQG